MSRKRAQSRRPAPNVEQSAVVFRRNVLIKQAMFDVRKIADVSDCASAPDVSAKLIGVAFAHKNASIAPGRTRLRNFSRCPVVVTNFINRVQSVYPRGKMQRGDLFLAVESEITVRRRTFARANGLRMRTASARAKQEMTSNKQEELTRSYLF